MRLVVSPVGSNLFNGIVMKAGTVICIASSEQFDTYSATFLGSSEHFVYYFPAPDVRHFEKVPSKWNIELMLPAVKQCLYCDKHHRFSSSEKI